MTVRQFEPEDEPRVLVLLQETFGRWPAQIESMTSAEFFNWKHMSSPFGPSVMYVGELNGELAGFTAYMPWLFTDGRRSVRALRGVDFAVAPRFRRHGVSHAIRTAASSLTGAAFLWANPNALALRGGPKAGRRTSGRVPHYARVSGRPLRLARRAVRAPTRTARHLQIGAGSAGAVLTDPNLSRVAHVTPPQGRLATARDTHYLRWRYGQLDEYRAVHTLRGDKPGGVAIFRMHRYRSVWITDVCELLLDSARRTETRQLLREVGKSAAGDLISCSFLSRREAAALGFVQASRGATLITYPLERPVTPDLTSSSTWALSRGDLELL